MKVAMERSGGVQTRAAEMLGMTFRSFRYFAKKYGLTVRDKDDASTEEIGEEAAVLAGGAE